MEFGGLTPLWNFWAQPEFALDSACFVRRKQSGQESAGKSTPTSRPSTAPSHRVAPPTDRRHFAVLREWCLRREELRMQSPECSGQPADDPGSEGLGVDQDLGVARGSTQKRGVG